MASKTDGLTDDDVADLSIDEAVSQVQDIIGTLEEGDASLSEAQTLHENATKLLDYLEDELEVADGEVNRVQPE